MMQGYTGTFLGNTPLPNPDAGVNAINWHNKIVLAYNPSEEKQIHLITRIRL